MTNKLKACLLSLILLGGGTANAARTGDLVTIELANGVLGSVNATIDEGPEFNINVACIVYFVWDFDGAGGFEVGIDVDSRGLTLGSKQLFTASGLSGIRDVTRVPGSNGNLGVSNLVFTDTTIMLEIDYGMFSEGSYRSGRFQINPEPIELRSIYPLPQIEVVDVSEPGVAALMGLGLAGLVLVRRTKKTPAKKSGGVRRIYT